MATKIYWVQLGGNPVENDDSGFCMFPAHPMVPESCAADYGFKPQKLDWHGPTAGHRGFGSFANQRILDFTHYDYCMTNCLLDHPMDCYPQDDCKPIGPMGQEGWPNQVGLMDYYCRIEDELAVGDCFATHIVSANEEFEKFYYSIERAAPGVQVQFKTMCSKIELTPVLTADAASQTIGVTEVPLENRFASLCDGFDVVLMEIVSMPPKADDDTCKDEKGLLEGFAVSATVRTNQVNSGK